jgi:hypothetical protein
MGFPITTTQPGFTCFAFPDVCKTPAPPGSPIPIPYPNIGQLSDATGVSDNGSKGKVEVGGYYVLLNDSEIPQTTGDEAGSVGGVRSGVTRGKVTFTQGSASVKIYGQSVVRMSDPTEQNNGNAVGQVIGGVPNVLVGG